MGWIVACGCGAPEAPRPAPARPAVVAGDPAETVTVDRTARPPHRDPAPPRRAASDFKLVSSTGFTLLPCSEESRARSDEASTARVVDIVNRTHVRVSVYWLDYQGVRVHYADLAPGAGYEQPTYLTHPWILVDDRGACIGIATPKFPAFPGDESVIAAVPG